MTSVPPTADVAIGGGYSKRKAQLDTPRGCALPVSDHLLNRACAFACVVDSCNYRLSLTVRWYGQPCLCSCHREQLRSSWRILTASSICYDAESSGAFVVATVGANDRRLLHYSPRPADWRREGLMMTPRGHGRQRRHRLYRDTARHRLVAYDAATLQFLGHSGGYSDRQTRWHHRSGEPIFSSPYDIVAHDGELFVSDTHNDRVQVLAARHPARWIGVIGQSGHGPGEFTYPQGLAVARELLYVCEERQVQALTLNGEPRMIIPLHAAGGLCGICSDGRRIFVTDIDRHKVHVLRLTNDRRAAAQVVRDQEEARQRAALRSDCGGFDGREGGSAGKDAAGATDDGAVETSATTSAAAQERKAKETQRDLALQRAFSAPANSTIHRVLGLPTAASRAEVMQAVRFALRLLHPDRGINLALRGMRRARGCLQKGQQFGTTS